MWVRVPPSASSIAWVRVGILTGGGDCPGLNAVIRAAGRRVMTRGGEVVGVREGWNGLVEGTVRVRPLVVAQSDEAQWAIRARFEELLEEHRAGDGFEVPVAVKLGSGRKP